MPIMPMSSMPCSVPAPRRLPEPFPEDAAGTLVRTTLADYPGRLAAAVFLRGCNLRCPYCYNRALVLPDGGGEGFVGAGDILSHLAKRRNVLSALVISGGEPLLNPLTPQLIRAARSLGYKIKLDTNGTLPRLLEQFCASAELRPDYVAMDIKTAPQRYAELVPRPGGSVQPPSQFPAAAGTAVPPDGAALAAALRESAALLAREYEPDCREWRTVLVPGLVGERDIEAAAALLPCDAQWYFSPFRGGGCLDPAFDALPPYSDSDMQRLVAAARRTIPGARLR